MSLERELKKRSNSVCELCSSDENLQVYVVPPSKDENLENALMACKICAEQIENPEATEANHWRCLNDSMWSEHKAVQVVAWRMLSRLRKEGWPQDLLDMMYLDEETLEFAKATGEGEDDPNKVIHRDVNGVILEVGDSVVLIKDLKVKGSSMVAKQGTAVRNIRLDRDNEKYIEGKVGPTQIVIITDYVKKI
ncbi:PhnA domain-containing protein [Flavobacteriaceae bacterium S0825]|uniref:PhnA domain-containing protein n=1 Tax=Gaetbulibacter sp. S0825 TaxID=2720084 RepID=UPI00143085C3|nr:alkylphosphonate utilization protein [Gaetbulibacter sp. S0825]MCK0107830.1 PhnA domain-containing protein [Flavobacteriaceae bacterium S0825]NIX63466.1 PhnA protein [Gaetbulibacter sp. S0825]